MGTILKCRGYPVTVYPPYQLSLMQPLPIGVGKQRRIITLCNVNSCLLKRQSAQQSCDSGSALFAGSGYEPEVIHRYVNVFKKLAGFKIRIK